MAERYELSPASRLDLIDIEDWTLAHFGLDQALVLADQFTDTFESLAGNPGMGHTRDDLTPTGRALRYWTVLQRFLVVYEQEDKCIRIVRVLNGWRDLRTILEEED